MKVFSYVIVNDKGGAPNYDAPKTTLALCKPKIRLKAKQGDLVMAFCGKPLGLEPHAVCWAGIVAEKMTFDEYWNDPRYSGKKPDKAQHPDNIYYLTDNGYEQIENHVHKPKDKLKDTGGKFVLIFDPSWCFRSSAKTLPEEFERLRLPSGARRGHHIDKIDGPMWKRLQKWLDKNRSSKTPFPDKQRNDHHC